jgi:type IV pilus assembly protein PilF
VRILAPVLAAAALSGCVSQTSVETRSVQDATLVDSRRRAEVHTSLASEYYQRGNVTIALEETRLAIRDDPSYVPAYNVRALVFMELREDAQARAAFESALRIAPDDPEVMNNYGWFLCLRGEAARGMEYFTRVQANNFYGTPEKPLFNAGLCSRLQGRNTEAEDYLRRALVLQPNIAGALATLAEILYERGQYKEAEAYLVRYMRLGEPNLTALVLGVRIARAMGEKAAEDSLLQQLRRRFPDAPQTRDVVEERK